MIKYSDLSLGQIEAIGNKLGGMDGIRRLLADELVVTEKLVTFERNEYGHVVLTFTGLDLTGAAEVERLHNGGNLMSDYAKSCFLSTKKDSYDKRHRLVAGQTYRVALMPGREIERGSDRTTEALRRRGMERYGYGKPLAGLVPRIREVLSDERMKELDIWYVAALHEPITDSDGYPGVLYSYRDDGGGWVFAGWGRPVDQWYGFGSFAFQVVAS